MNMNKYHIDEEVITGKLIGYTDFTKIYLNEKLSGNQLYVVRLHECAHIWLKHNTRRIAGCNAQLWNVACDMEIALHLYSDVDEEEILAPRSMLKGGITKKNCEQYPLCIYAEEFYAELLKVNDAKVAKQWEDMILGDSLEDAEDVDVQEIIYKLKAINTEIKAEKAIQKQQYQIDNFTSPKPSLASEVDSIRRNRSLLTRVKSYNRPSRRDGGDYIKKGVVSKWKSAKITIYVDRSGSFCADKTNAANDQVVNVARKYRGDIKVDYIYFNNRLIIKDPIHGRGGTNYDNIVHNINNTSSEMNIIITDDDNCNELFSKEKILVIPIGCNTTKIASVLRCVEIKI